MRKKVAPFISVLFGLILCLYSCKKEDKPRIKLFDFDDNLHPRRFNIDSKVNFRCYYEKENQIVCYDSSNFIKVIYNEDATGAIRKVSSYKKGKKHGYFISNQKDSYIERVYFLDTLVFDCLTPDVLYLLRPTCTLDKSKLKITDTLGIDIVLFQKRNFKFEEGILTLYNEQRELIFKEIFNLNSGGGAYIKIHGLFKELGKYYLECEVKKSKEDENHYILEKSIREFKVLE